MSKELNKAPVEQAGGDEREAFELFVRKHCGMPEHIAVNWDAKFTNDAWEGWKARAALAHRAPEVCSECSDTGKVYDESGDGPWSCYACTGNPEVIGYANGDELDNMLDDRTAVLSPGKTSFHTVPVYRLIRAALAQPSPMRCLACGGYHGNSGLPCPNMRVTAQAQPSPAQAEQHWPKLEKPAQVGAIRFSAGVSSRLVVEAAQRLYEFESTPEQEAERIERLQAFREQLDPLNLAPHAEAFNEAPAEALKPEQAEAERPEVVAWQYRVTAGPQTGWSLWHPGKGEEFERSYTVERRPLMTVAQHERIVKAWIERWKAYIELSAKIAAQRDAANNRLHEVATACATAEQERDAALARVAELTATRNRYGVDAHYFNKNLQRILRDFESFTPDELARSLIILAKVADEKVVAQAQHSVPEEFIGRLSEFLAQRGATGKALLRELRTVLAAAPGKEGV
ncbi:hypothetical protein ACM75V_13940 [Pseudomonas aeruginosa]